MILCIFSKLPLNRVEKHYCQQIRSAIFSVQNVKELIGFGDVSLCANASVIYVGWKVIKTAEVNPDQLVVKFVWSNASVFPDKRISPSKTEVSSFLILTRLLRLLVNKMDNKPSRIKVDRDNKICLKVWCCIGNKFCK